ncbi:MAG: PKD domain-containing protein, partial [Thermoplasmata archaeon]
MIYELAPATSYWYQLVVYNGAGAAASSNVLEVTQPSLPGLSLQVINTTSIELDWTNPSSYGGLLSFAAYLVNSSTTGVSGTGFTYEVVTDASVTSAILSGLPEGTPLLFTVTLEDACCAGEAIFSASPTVTVTLGTTSPLSAELFSGAASADQGRAVDLDCLAAGGEAPYGYTWQFGDGASGTGGPTQVHAFGETGNFLVTCSVTDSAGNVSSAQAEVVVSPDPALHASSSATAVAPGTPVTFLAVPTGGPGPFSPCEWNFGNGASAAGSSVTYAFPSVGNYTVGVTVTDGNGVPASAFLSVEVRPLLVTASVERSGTVIGAALEFRARADGGSGSGYNFTWTFGDGSGGFGANVSHDYRATGTFDPRLTVTDGLGARSVSELVPV